MNEATKIKADRISRDRYQELKSNEADRLASNYVMSCISKGKNKLEQAQTDYASGKLHKMFSNKAVEILTDRGLLEKGSRSGHINKAPVEIQEKYNSLKADVDSLKFSADGVDYTCTLLCKKVVVEAIAS